MLWKDFLAELQNVQFDMSRCGRRLKSQQSNMQLIELAKQAWCGIGEGCMQHQFIDP